MLLGPLGVVLGIVSRNRINGSGGARSGAGLALAAIIVGALATVISIIGIFVLLRSGTNPLMPYGQS